MLIVTDAELTGYVQKKELVTLFRSFDEPDLYVSGYLLVFSTDLLLLQREDEFLLNGYSVLRRRDLEGIRCGPYEKTLHKILRAEGVLEGTFGIEPPLPPDSWPDLFRALKRRDLHVIVECEEEEEPGFFIGPVELVSLHSVGVQTYDPDGQLAGQWSIIPFENITKVTFGDRYTTVFRKYLKPPRKKKS
ncbi:hypothetical protein [Flaviaesturariibacter aridisoli]|uniref:Uncharacterized protein n=1 Tax=Flaviaesturariibacter aridisoli TaxID=2545761 RepID=A0A4R4E363_9BACT|nr:hypothetical protein [Flaviaesturariibacter aridisoli]TCZ70440.1 hypothetical protein E0486_10820 [Flaviaesturariibacter aridisoli]